MIVMCIRLKEADRSVQVKWNSFRTAEFSRLNNARGKALMETKP